MTYVDIDTDASTFNSSSAVVTVPAGASVLYANLSWSGETSAGGGPGALPPRDASMTGLGTVSFKTPGGSYSTLTSSRTDTSRVAYQGYVDVTNAVQTAGTGTYTVANVRGGTGTDRYAGCAVAYCDPTAPILRVAAPNSGALGGLNSTLIVPIGGGLAPGASINVAATFAVDNGGTFWFAYNVDAIG